MRILLIEDDKLLAEGIRSALTHFHYTVDWFSEGHAALSALSEAPYSLAVLDLGLPDMEGLEVLRRARQKKIDLPFLILTAREQIDDKIAGLDAGADDYMAKPFDIKELEARIRTLTRRAQGRRTDIIQVATARLDLKQRQLFFRGETITFSRREFTLIQAFFERPKQVYTRDVLENLLYSWHEEIDSNALEVHIHRLRRKIGNKAIKTIRGVGYMLVAEQLE